MACWSVEIAPPLLYCSTAPSPRFKGDGEDDGDEWRATIATRRYERKTESDFPGRVA